MAASLRLAGQSSPQAASDVKQTAAFRRESFVCDPNRDAAFRCLDFSRDLCQVTHTDYHSYVTFVFRSWGPQRPVGQSVSCPRGSDVTTSQESRDSTESFRWASDTFLAPVHRATGAKFRSNELQNLADKLYAVAF